MSMSAAVVVSIFVDISDTRHLESGTSHTAPDVVVVSSVPTPCLFAVHEHDGRRSFL